jgi:hypothetical protein
MRLPQAFMIQRLALLHEISERCVNAFKNLLKGNTIIAFG